MAERFAKLTQALSIATLDLGLSQRETMVLTALMHHGVREDGVIGVSRGGYAMTEMDVSKYFAYRLKHGNVKKIVSNLMRKGVIEARSKKRVGTRDVVIHALTPKAVAAIREAQALIDAIDRGEVTEPSPVQVTEPSHTPEVSTRSITREVTFYEIENTLIEDSKSAHFSEMCPKVPSSYCQGNDGPGSYPTVEELAECREITASGIRHPYPHDEDEVRRYLESVEGRPEYDMVPFMLVDEDAVWRFYRDKVRSGWRYPDGSVVRDWHYAVIAYACAIAGACCGTEFDMPSDLRKAVDY